jgi:TonB-dependent starch-binding outer membrane protein SusC
MWSVLIYFMVMALPGYAQNTTSISGKVVGENGAPLPSVTVKVQNQKLNVSRTGQSNADGQYAIDGLPMGAGYVVTFTYVGYAERQLSGVSLLAAVNTQPDVQLEFKSDAMDDVVVVGYGRSAKRGVTASSTRRRNCCRAKCRA